MNFEPDDLVTIAYTGYTVSARVIADPAPGPYGLPGRDWVLVEEIIEGRDDGPQYEAAREFIVPAGETPPPGPFEAWTGGKRLDEWRG